MSLSDICPFTEFSRCCYSGEMSGRERKGRSFALFVELESRVRTTRSLRPVPCYRTMTICVPW